MERKNQTTTISRREFLLMLAALPALSACQKVISPTKEPPKSTKLPPTATDTAEPKTSTATPYEIKQTPTERFSEQKRKVKTVMEAYGVVDEEKLSDAYWIRLNERISRFGPAKRILALEYHGDDYSMFGGAYSMTPQQFETQMRYLCQEDYHAVTGPELVGYLEGWLDMPARSVILTTDSGNASQGSLSRMAQLFEKLRNEFGFAPHFHSYIWTNKMDEGETVTCLDDACWQAFRKGLESGFFTFGSHTESHRDFREMTKEEGFADILQSKEEIEKNLGLSVYSLSWPFEACPVWLNDLQKEGFTFGYGGTSRFLGKAYTYKEDNLAMCLPRLLPPNPNGVSGRPSGANFQEMLSKASEDYEPID